MSVAPEPYRFDRWQLDTQRRLLYTDGKLVPLNSRAFDILALLIARRGALVTRDEIVAHVWNGLVVGDNNLTVQISTLRRILGNDADGAPLIVTVPGRGYRFAGEVTDEHTIAVADSSTTRPAISHGTQSFLAEANVTIATTKKRKVEAAGLITLSLLLLAGAAFIFWNKAPSAPRLSIAVLPFRNLSADHSQDYLADALTDDLTTDLAHIPRAIVIARESSASWRDRLVQVQQIGRSLDVRYILEGSLQVVDGQFHVNAQLIDAGNGAHLWADRFDQTRGRILDVQNAIVRHIASALNFRLVDEESARSLQDRPNNPDALDLYLRARATLDQDDSLASYARAQAMLEHAITLQPDFGDALAELGATLLTKVRDMEDPNADADFAEARVTIHRALGVSPQNARALAAEARSLSVLGKYDEATSDAIAALAIEPSSIEAETVLSVCAQAEGRLEEAVKRVEAILQLDPSSPYNKSRFLMLGVIQLIQGRIQEASGRLHQAVAADQDGAAKDSMGRVEVARLMLIAASQMSGDVAEASRLYKAYRTDWPNRTVWRISELFPRSYANLPGFRRVLDALTDAGMPRYADEQQLNLTSEVSCPGSDFDTTPTTVKGGRVWDTTTLAKELRLDRTLLLLDLGRGAADPPNAIFYEEGLTPESAAEFAIRVVSARALQNWDVPIALMGDGMYGCAAYQAATKLVAKGYRNVAWYRGGEEAWAAASMPSTDRRSR